MPSRVVRGEIVSSRSLARVSRDAANLFIRLVLVVDEFGRMDGRWRVIHSETYGDRDDTTVKQVEQWAEELCQEGCAERYEVGRDWVLRLPSNEKYRAKRNRAEKSNFPCRCGTYDACECAPLLSASSCGETRREISSDASGSGGLGVMVKGSGSGAAACAAEGPLSDGSDPAPPAPRSRKAGKTAAPESLTAEQIAALAAWCSSHEDPGVRNRARRLSALAESCLDHHRAKENRFADWVATVRTWIRNDVKFSRDAGKEPTLAECLLEERREAARAAVRARINAEYGGTGAPPPPGELEDIPRWGGSSQ